VRIKEKEKKKEKKKKEKKRGYYCSLFFSFLPSFLLLNFYDGHILLYQLLIICECKFLIKKSTSSRNGCMALFLFIFFPFFFFFLFHMNETIIK
jgi:hypothetical protein